MERLFTTRVAPTRNSSTVWKQLDCVAQARLLSSALPQLESLSLSIVLDAILYSPVESRPKIHSERSWRSVSVAILAALSGGHRMRSSWRVEDRMRSAVSLALVTSMLGSALPVAAQQNTPLAGPISHSIIPGAARFATLQESNVVDSEWSRVRTLAPGTEVILIVKDLELANRYFVAGDESDVTVLNVGNPALPSAAREVLRDLASAHPQYFLAAQKGGQFALEKSVRVGPGGVFVADRKVGDLAQVVEQYGRHDITEIKTATIESNPAGCAFAGYLGGGIVGGIPGAVVGGAVGKDTGPALLGMMIGWSMGAVYVYRKCRHKPERVIYSAP